MKQYHKESWDKVNYKDYNDNEILSYINEANEEAIELIEKGECGVFREELVKHLKYIED